MLYNRIWLHFLYSCCYCKFSTKPYRGVYIFLLAWICKNNYEYSYTHFYSWMSLKSWLYLTEKGWTLCSATQRHDTWQSLLSNATKTWHPNHTQKQHTNTQSESAPTALESWTSTQQSRGRCPGRKPTQAIHKARSLSREELFRDCTKQGIHVVLELKNTEMALHKIITYIPWRCS